ncbi:hypothetical protein A1Q1_05066 [Trichosporon asahii var. asahii CBS 2479]|uniref:DNL-type domain-containing protein n=1 Tax=Trichosporon asahii var. asahii (strain ATCC 90039 / CBS 2479 / JCM 2466 / KCTC 7840 / NBRC 103889/ NCYC 2677 / UAMH 7654) TaxID=1186058 RepID=J6EPQ6_TRIAS|nr:hypothetical protein A1Q1_05066 [Trichosporon asahii var. asahii CBS 2479]EJT46419.1 hypothetical protein A1Q1_05066 [Trichosporon asahii var. asahii CBS 2479]
MASRSLLRTLRPMGQQLRAVPRMAPSMPARAFSTAPMRWDERSTIDQLKKGVADLGDQAKNLMNKLESEAKDFTDQAKNHGSTPKATDHSIPPSTAGQVDPEGEVRDPMAGNHASASGHTSHGLPPPASGTGAPSAEVNGGSVPIGQVEPRLQLTFTCTAGPERNQPECGERSTHEFSKNSYENGIVLVQCPKCQARHLIADHLGWFKEITKDGQLKTLEDIMKDKGDDAITKGRINQFGTIEFPPEAGKS